jgi:hypothetical protein
MTTLLPIIRRARRPLLPPDDNTPAVPSAVVDVSPSVPPVETVASAPAQLPAAPAVEPKAKKRKTKHVPAQPAIDAA